MTMPQTPLPPQDGTVPLPPDRNLGAMVDKIITIANLLESPVSCEAEARVRLGVIYDTASRLKVALAQREAVMGDMAKALGEDGHGAPSIHCGYPDTGGGSPLAVNCPSCTALAKYKKAHRVP